MGLGGGGVGGWREGLGRGLAGRGGEGRGYGVGKKLAAEDRVEEMKPPWL